MQPGWPVYALWMAVAGMGIPVLAMTTGSIGARIGNAPAASAIALALACASAALIAIWVGGTSRAALMSAPLPYYLGGLLMGFYLVSIAFVAPRFGLANAIIFVLFGQIVAALIIDHFGLFGAVRTPIDPVRLLGVGLMFGGIMLARRG